jgi:putative transposase
MAKPYSLDLRERAVARVEAGESVRFVARVPNIGPSRVVKWSRRFKATGSPGEGGRLPAAHSCW